MRRVKWLSAAACVALATVVWATPALAYHLGPYSWESGSVGYDASSNLPWNWENAVFNAAETWDWYSSGFDLWIGTTPVNKWLQEDLGWGGAIAETWIYDPIEDGVYLTHVDSVFNTYNNFYTDGRDYDVETVALHEFGHWLILEDIPWYEFWNSGAVMWYAYNGVQHDLASDDINGLRAIYGN